MADGRKIGFRNGHTNSFECPRKDCMPCLFSTDRTQLGLSSPFLVQKYNKPNKSTIYSVKA